MTNDSIRRAAEMLRQIKESEKTSQAQIERDRRNLVMGIGKDIVDAITPFLKKLVGQVNENNANVERAISQMKINVQVPDVNVPEIRVPEPKVSVTVPPIKIPEIRMPEEMNVRGWVGLMGVDLDNPLPVQLRDANGNPVRLFDQITQVGGSSGGGPRIVKVSNLDEISITTTGLTDAELRASSVPVSQASGASFSVNVEQIFGSTITSLLNGDNRIPVSVETGGSGLTDAELRATSVPVSQVSGAVWSTEVTNTVTVDGSGVTQPVSATDLDIRDLANATDSVSAYQVSGAVWSTEVTNTVTVTGSLTSTVAVGDIPSDGADTGSAPVKTGGIARTANPTAVANGDRVSATFDTVGRQVMRPLQVRGLLATAYASVSNGTETTLLAGATSTYHDLVWVMGANQSDAAVLLDIRSTTGGNVLMSLEIPANSTAGIAPAVPYPAGDVGASWTVDMDDITGTTVDITALFSKEV